MRCWPTPSSRSQRARANDSVAHFPPWNSSNVLAYASAPARATSASPSECSPGCTKRQRAAGAQRAAASPIADGTRALGAASARKRTKYANRKPAARSCAATSPKQRAMLQNCRACDDQCCSRLVSLQSVERAGGSSTDVAFSS